MDNNQMKNIVVLKNLPSNLVEEAIVILKSRKNVKKLEYIDKKENRKKDDKNKNDYIIREAECVISNYINLIERKDKKEDNEKINKKYKRLKIYSIIVTLFLILFLAIWIYR